MFSDIRPRREFEQGFGQKMTQYQVVQSGPSTWEVYFEPVGGQQSFVVGSFGSHAHAVWSAQSLTAAMARLEMARSGRSPADLLHTVGEITTIQ